MQACNATVPRTPVTRRVVLQRLGAGTLLALGLWPGALRAGNKTPAGSFRFLVINDTHCLSRECGPYLEGVVAHMKQANSEFCLHAGDLTEKGERHHLETVKDIFGALPGRMYPVIGNHDYLTQTDRRAYTQTFPLRLNYYFRHRGWQFVGLDSSDGLRYEKTAIQPATFRWLDEYLPRLDRKRPTVVFTHFPLGAGVNYRPANADALLDRFREFNLQAVFSGHYHGFTERTAGDVKLTTNRCCALKRANHDGTKEKGYFLCEASHGRIERTFVEYKAG
jgi:3',5'-cyclic AMP phosphodiesterase CpdA